MGTLSYLQHRKAGECQVMGRVDRVLLWMKRMLCALPFLIALSLNPESACAQTSDLQIDGTVRGDGKRLSGAKVQVFQDGNSFDQLTTSSYGKFYFELPLDHNYLLIYSKPGYVTKRINIDTRGIPEKIAKNGFSYGGWEVDIFSEVEGLDVSILQKPVAKMSYSSSVGNFDYDKEYTKSIQDELTRMQKELLRLENKYKTLLLKGDNAVKSENFDEAIGLYQEALKIKPKQDYPKKQIEKARQLKAEKAARDAELLAKEKQYKEIIEEADASFSSTAYEAAKEKYKQASAIFPSRPYPRDRINRINSLLADKAAAEANKKALEEKYNNLITKADKAFAVKQYVGARTSYKAALSIKPDEQYPKDKIEEINGILVEMSRQKDLEQKYNKAVSRGNEAFARSEFEKARTAFKEALELKPAEPYPKKRLEEIEKRLRELQSEQEINARYNAAVTKANKLFDSKSYRQAKTAYQEALAIKDEPYPRSRIAEIDKILKDLAAAKSLDERYRDQIETADMAFESKQYKDALAAYRAASALKPAESYPKERIQVVNALLKEISEAQSLETRYAGLIKSADHFFEIKQFKRAGADYESALELKPGEAYPVERIAEIDKLLQELAQNTALEAQYKKKIQLADNAFRSRKYTDAKNAYQAALALKPEEEYPQKQIAEIERRLQLEQDAKDAEKRYSMLISSADEKFGNKKYKEAKADYKKASALKPLEAYPREQLRKIDKILDDIAARLRKQNEAMEALYKKTLSEADFYFKTRDYANAKIKYQEALKIKQSASYPRSQLARINQLTMGNAGKQVDEAKYEQLISQADELFKSLKYKEAEVKYKKASEMKPFAEYPKRKLVEISTALADRIAQKKAEEERKKRLAMLEEQRRRNQEIANKVNEGNDNQQEEISSEEAEFMQQLAREYPQGITEISTQEGSQTILKRIVVAGNKGYEYKRVVHSWGGRFYFKNGHPITELVWQKETAPGFYN
ncbi:MAG: hypothetical protein ACE5DN_00970 [Flavobacteriales bacterium]